MTKKERKKMKQAGIENFGKKTQREIPSWLKGSFDDPADIDWNKVEAYERTIRDFMLNHGAQFCEFVQEKTGCELYYDLNGKVFGSQDVKTRISQDQFEKLLAEFIFNNVINK